MKKRGFEKYINKDVLISVFYDKNNQGNFYVGFVLACDEKYVLLESVELCGYEDGLRLVLLDCVHAVDENVLYCNKLHRLFNIKNQIRVQYSFSNKNLLKALLCYAKEEKLLIELCDNGSRLGFVAEFDDSILTLNSVGQTGAKLGTSFFLLRRINNLNCNNLSLADIALLIERTDDG